LIGLAGIGLMLGSVIITQLGSFPLWSIDEIAAVVARLAASMIGAFVLSLVALRTLPRLAAFNRLVLQSETRASEGYVSSSREHDNDLIGKEGVSVSQLRPAGIALVDGQRLDVVTDGEFIGMQRSIKIVEARGNHIVVRPL
jgi:membrane-bound serine protease (ClpP class)